MLHTRVNPNRMLAILLFGVVIVMAAASCAAPVYRTSTPEVSSPSFSSSPPWETFKVYTLGTSTPGEDAIEGMAAGLKTMRPDELETFGSIPGILDNLEQGAPLGQENGFVWPQHVGLPYEAYYLALPEIVFGRSPIVCVEEQGQAFLFFDKMAVTDLLGERLGAPEYTELASLVASCGYVGCPKCGCVGPMSGPGCTSSTLEWDLDPLILFIEPPTPSP